MEPREEQDGEERVGSAQKDDENEENINEVGEKSASKVRTEQVKEKINEVVERDEDKKVKSKDAPGHHVVEQDLPSVVGAASLLLRGNAPGVLAASGAVRTVATLLVNLERAPGERRYRTIRVGNPKIAQALACAGTEALLLATCFVHGAGTLEVPLGRSDAEVAGAARAGLDALTAAATPAAAALAAASGVSGAAVTPPKSMRTVTCGRDVAEPEPVPNSVDASGCDPTVSTKVKDAEGTSPDEDQRLCGPSSSDRVDTIEVQAIPLEEESVMTVVSAPRPVPAGVDSSSFVEQSIPPLSPTMDQHVADNKVPVTAARSLSRPRTRWTRAPRQQNCGAVPRGGDPSNEEAVASPLGKLSIEKAAPERPAWVLELVARARAAFREAKRAHAAREAALALANADGKVHATSTSLGGGTISAVPRCREATASVGHGAVRTRPPVVERPPCIQPLGAVQNCATVADNVLEPQLSSSDLACHVWVHERDIEDTADLASAEGEPDTQHLRGRLRENHCNGQEGGEIVFTQRADRVARRERHGSRSSTPLGRESRGSSRGKDAQRRNRKGERNDDEFVPGPRRRTQSRDRSVGPKSSSNRASTQRRSMSELKLGDKVEGQVVKVTKLGTVVDVGFTGNAFLPSCDRTKPNPYRKGDVVSGLRVVELNPHRERILVRLLDTSPTRGRGDEDSEGSEEAVLSPIATMSPCEAISADTSSSEEVLVVE